MKWIFEVLKYILGYFYMAWKALAFLLIGTAYFLWEFKLSSYKKVWEYIFENFYSERSRDGETTYWSYKTMDDWVKGEKSLR
jgi:hypothetical protein